MCAAALKLFSCVLFPFFRVLCNECIQQMQTDVYLQVGVTLATSMYVDVYTHHIHLTLTEHSCEVGAFILGVRGSRSKSLIHFLHRKCSTTTPKAKLKSIFQVLL